MSTRQRNKYDTNDAGQDSFLDIVANIVGILIILVMVMGVRAKNAPVSLSISSPEQQAAQRELEKEEAEEQGLHRAVLDTAARISVLEQAQQARAAERDRLALMNAAAEKMIDQRRKELGQEARENFDRRRKLEEDQIRLAALENQYELTSRVKNEAIQIDSYPTPLSQTVYGRELHLQLRGGRVTVLPWDEIIEELKALFERSINRMRTQAVLNGTTRPIGGFRVEYTIERHDTPMRTYEQTGQGGSYIQLSEFSLIPVSSQLGEPLEVALAPQSDLSRALAQHRPGRTTITAWVYPDSFEQYRQLKKVLYEAGYTLAARPLPEGEQIGGSPKGSRSAAQ